MASVAFASRSGVLQNMTVVGYLSARSDAIPNSYSDIIINSDLIKGKTARFSTTMNHFLYEKQVLCAFYSVCVCVFFISYTCTCILFFFQPQ